MEWDGGEKLVEEGRRPYKWETRGLVDVMIILGQKSRRL